MIPAPNDAMFDVSRSARCAARTTITIDDELIAKAQGYTGIQENSALVRKALEALIEPEAAQRLARLGGTGPDLKPIPKRRPKAA